MAEHRGVALQLTNILRDLVEDARRDRIYLPRAELDEYGYTPADLLAGRANDAFDPVPLLLINPPAGIAGIEDGRLCDVAPTLLQLLGLPQPKAMTGRALLKTRERASA